MEKKWYESSTIWINLAGMVVVGLKLILDSNLIPDQDVTAILLSLVNIINRFRVSPNEKVGAIEKAVV